VERSLFGYGNLIRLWSDRSSDMSDIRRAIALLMSEFTQERETPFNELLGFVKNSIQLFYKN